jgi:hypothetical protein
LQLQSPKKDKTLKHEFGETVPGIDFGVFNERAVRAAAGILFLIGFFAWSLALLTENYGPLRAFGALFMLDMFIRLFFNAKYSPSMFLGSLIVKPQRPEWVDANPKKIAWYLGFGFVSVSCFTMGWLALTGPIPLVLCGVCISLLFLESSFGICVGCELARRFSKQPPRLCPGDVCNYTPEKS